MSASKVVMKIVNISFSILVVVLILFGLYKIGDMAFQFGYRVFMEEPVASEEDGKDKVVQISQGMEAKDIGDALENRGLIRDANLFMVQLKLSSYANQIKPGNYTLSTSMTAREMMQIMSAENTDGTETEA